MEFRSHENGEVTRKTLHGVCVCENHKRSTQAKFFLTDKAFQIACDAMRDAGKTIPRRELATVGWIHA
jgi:hypothetical protein